MTSTQPPRTGYTPRRADCFTAGLLIVALGAAYLASRGAGPPALAQPIMPDGWRLAYAPPEGWVAEGETIDVRGIRSRHYQGPGRRVLTVRRAEVAGDLDLESFCLEMLGDVDLQVILGGARDGRMTETRLGSWSAVQLGWTPRIMGQVIGQHVYLIGALTEENDSGTREGYALELRSPAPLHPRDKHLWEMIVDAVTVQPEGT